MSEIIRVKHTYLSKVQPGDVPMWRAGSLLMPDWDALGRLIAALEGNKGTDRDPNAPGFSKGDYTHCGWIGAAADPEAEVEACSDRPNVFKIKDGSTWETEETIPGRWEEEQAITVKRVQSHMPIRIHSTYPVVRRETIDLEHPHLEMWRLRRATPDIIEGILKLANDMIGYRYDLANFLTFGGLHLAAARICSEFVSDLAYYSSMLRSKEYPICCTPDIAQNKDAQKTPNDLINSGELIRFTHQGLLPEFEWMASQA